MINKLKAAFSADMQKIFKHESFMERENDLSMITTLALFALFLGAGFGIDGELQILLHNAHVLGLQMVACIATLTLILRIFWYMLDLCTLVKPVYKFRTLGNDLLFTGMMGLGMAAGFFNANEIYYDLLNHIQNSPLTLATYCFGLWLGMYVMALGGNFIVILGSYLVDTPREKAKHNKML